MTDEKKKHYLEQYMALDMHIDELILEKKHWYDRALHITPVITGMPHQSCKNDRTGTAIERVIMLERQIDEEIDRLCDLRKIISDAMEKLSDGTMIRIIHLKYVCGMTYEQIAESVGYCSKQVRRIHNAAISRLELDIPEYSDVAV